MKKLIKILSITIIIISALFFDYFLPYSKADNLPVIPSEVEVSQNPKGLFYDGPGVDNLLIFYPGAKVDTKAYEPIVSKLAKDGIDCFVVDMPFHFAIFNANGAEAVLEKYKYKNYYIAGHSLGGAMAASYLSKNDNWKKFKGIIFLASYSTSDFTDTDIKALSLYGSNDGVLNISKVKSGRKYFKKENYTEKVIQGGNHAQFGSYGNQSGDNDASISAENQWNETVEAIESFIIWYNRITGKSFEA